MRKELNAVIENQGQGWAWLEAMGQAGLVFPPETSAADHRPANQKKAFTPNEARAADALMQQAILQLGFDTVLAIVSLHAHRAAIEARFGKKPKLAIVVSASDFRPALAFLHKPSGLWIDNPREAPDGRFTVDPLACYGISEDLACAICNANGRGF